MHLAFTDAELSAFLDNAHTVYTAIVAGAFAAFLLLRNR